MDSIIAYSQGSNPLVSKTLENVTVLNDNDKKEIFALGNVDVPPGRKQSVEDAVEQLQKAIEAIQGPQKMLEFAVHKETNAVMIKVINKETGDLIREVPPEKILDLAAKMMEITGIIVDKRI